MSVRKVRKFLTCSKCGSDLAGRFVKTIKSRSGRETDIYRCRCGGGRKIARGF